MSLKINKILLATMLGLGCGQTALADSFSVADGEQLTGRQTLSGNDMGTVGVNAVLKQDSNEAIRWSDDEPGTVSINNSGSILASDGARGIDTKGKKSTENHNFILSNNTGASIVTDNDSFRVDFKSGLVGNLNVENDGTMRSASGQVLDFAGLEAGEVIINNQQNGQMMALDHDAIRTGNADKVMLRNAGLISALADDRRAVDIKGDGGVKVIAIENSANGVIRSSGDAVRVDYDLSAGSLTLDNSGTIETIGLDGNAGQAIDFDSVSGADVSAQVYNRAGGVLRALDADAVRAGGEGKVTNAGLISAGGAGVVEGATSGSADGVDFQAHNGQVENLEGGIIEGGRHGVTGDGFIDVLNHRGGVITGKNGSGVNLDGEGRVVNHGVISGRHNTQLEEGDGDGVDIDYVGHIDNYGRIEGIGAAGAKNGDPNRADGIAMGGGTIINREDAIIYSSDRGILIDDSDGGEAFADTRLTNRGTIDALNQAVTFRGNRNDTIVNSGRIISRSNTTAINMGGGNDRLELRAGSDIRGRVDGGNGRNSLILTGAGSGRLEAVTAFEQFDVVQGKWLMDAELTVLSDEVLQINNDAQLTVSADTQIDGLLKLNLLGMPSELLFEVIGSLYFGEQSQFALEFSQWLPALGDVIPLFSAKSILGFSASSILITGMQDVGYYFDTHWQDGKQVLSMHVTALTQVSEPASAVIFGAGLLLVLLVVRRR